MILNIMPVYPAAASTEIYVPGKPVDLIQGSEGGVCFIVFAQDNLATRVRLVQAGGFIHDHERYIAAVSVYNCVYALVRID